MSVHFVAINHDYETSREKEGLMSPACRQAFKERVDPLITERSLVLCEGLNYHELIPPYHAGYEFVWKRFLNNETTRLPTIGGCDFRQEIPMEELQKEAQRHDDWYTLSSQIMSTESLGKPTTLEQAIKMLRNRKPSTRLLREPTDAEIELSQYLYAQTTKFDRMYLELMRKHRRDFDRIFVVAGAVHCISFTLKTGSPVIDLMESRFAATVYHAYLSIYHWSQLLKR